MPSPCQRRPSHLVPAFRGRAACALWCCLTACAEWPRANHLPPAVEAVPAGTDPRDAVVVSWTSREEVEPRSQPTGPADLGFGPGEGVIVTGALDGIGWNDEAVPELIVGADCGSEATRALVPGDYVGDADIVVVSLPARARLCLGLRAASESEGLDAVAWSLDACGVPVEAVSADAPLGLTGSGPLVEWSAEVDAGVYAVLVAAYYPNDDGRSVPYRLAVSAQPVTEVCPPFPVESSE